MKKLFVIIAVIATWSISSCTTPEDIWPYPIWQMYQTVDGWSFGVNPEVSRDKPNTCFDLIVHFHEDTADFKNCIGDTFVVEAYFAGFGHRDNLSNMRLCDYPKSTGDLDLYSLFVYGDVREEDEREIRNHDSQKIKIAGVLDVNPQYHSFMIPQLNFVRVITNN